MLPVRCCDWRQGEWQAALGALLGARQAVPQLQAELADYYQQDVRLLNSARAGIRLLLQRVAALPPVVPVSLAGVQVPAAQSVG